MVGGKSGYSLTGIPKIGQVQSPCINAVIAIGLVSEGGQPSSCQLHALVGTSGPGATVKGAIKAASDLGKVLPELCKETRRFPPCSPPKVSDSTAPGVIEWALSSSHSCRGRQVGELRSRTESPPGALVQRTERKLSAVIERSISYRIYIYYILFDSFFFFFFSFL